MSRLAASILAALTLGGCVNLAPADQRPPIPAPEHFPGGPTAQAAPLSTPVGWRDFFADARLRAVIERALANNRDLRMALANIASARAQYRVQRAALTPTLTAQAQANIAQQPASVAGGAAASGSVDSHDYSLTAGATAYQLDLFGKVRNLTQAAQAQLLASRAARDAAQITLISEVTNDYLAVGADRALLKIAQDTLDSGNDSLALTRRRLEAGVATAVDVSQAETIVDQARYDVARLTTQLAQDRNALDLVVGAPVEPGLLPNGLEDPVVVLARMPEAVGSRVLLTRPDVVEAEDQLRAANANIGAARAAFFPDISLTGSGGLSSLALSSLFKGAAGTWSFVPTVSQTLFDGGANRGNLDYAKAQRDYSLARYEKAVQTAFREVADALAQRATIDEQVSAQTALAAASANSLRLAQARYERGSDTYLNVLVARRSDYSAQQSLVAVQQLRDANLVSLYTALGGGLDAGGAPSP